jgi:threonine dehydratase
LLRCAGIELALDNGTRVWGKLEFLQRTGTFKARGALANLHALSREPSRLLLRRRLSAALQK